METIKSLQGIVEFVSVGETGSFSGAARQLGVSKSHISKMIRQLEEDLGATLLLRSTRKVQLTNLGEKYFQSCRQSLSNLRIAKSEITDLSQTPAGTLRISAAGVFGEEYIAPVLIKIAKDYPKLKIELDFSSRLVDLIEEKFDVAIRIGELKDSSLVAQRIASRLEYVVCSKGYLQQKGSLQDLSDLAQHNCLGERLLWTFKKRGKLIQVPVTGNFKSNNPRVILKAALSGLGVARLPGAYVFEEIKKGRLVSVLDQYSEGKKDIWVLTPARKQNLNVRMFVQELKSYLAEGYHDVLF